MILATAVSAAIPSLADAQDGRSVVPIREVVIRPIGTPRYVITVTVNGVPMEAGLDTGSVGLRLLPHAVRRAGVSATGPGYAYGYGSGVVLRGPDVQANVRIGGSQRDIALQAVRLVGCRDGGNRCPAGTLTPQQYGLMGSGQPGQGFPAILGIRLESGQSVNPLTALGVQRWIVHLPARGGGGGALILNPDARDRAGFVPLRTGVDRSGTVASCLMVARPDARQICGPTLWDTGAPGIAVKNAAAPSAWQAGVAAEMRFVTSDGSHEPRVAFRAGDREHGGHADFARAPQRSGVYVSAGTMPFYAYDMLYDSGSGTMAIRPNTAQRGLPQAIR